MNKINSIESFKFDIGGYYSTKFSVLLQESIVAYGTDEYHYGFELNKKDVPIGTIGLFISKLNEIKVLQWKSKYENIIVMDGIQWALEIQYNHTKTKKVYGSNNYPGSESDSLERSSEFDNFLDLIRLLIQDPSIEI